ncbi:nickel ABC transporter substrate-binding protein [Staphylococcus edaphicus]|uniref:ABC transporter substrate-binding protein n=1 Tax=Staphylococcus edaphicus TaxID=1955013 RepID=A0A2C6VI61_9STAP|nr:nickel ABC transporter substrate-binding protein [Staphylococcus edaphicus]PHK49911.1 nickel ABC transporter substrate-binding protein [Staphylococcus edaphicus]UQW81827.1 ABC transporter substrate-binding protein [Staphylococcus edaphicus]
MKKICALLATTAIVLAGCSGSGSESKRNTLNVELPLKTTSIAPYETDVPVKIGAAESLFKAGSDGKVQKLLVDTYKQKSPTQLDLKLKKDIKFQNGKKVTGKAVKASLEESMAKSDLVKGSLPIKDIKVNGQHMSITTKEAYPELVSELASPFSAIYDTNADTDVTKAPVGTGPYQIKDYKQSQNIKLDRFNEYWQGKPKLKQVNVTYQEDGHARTSDLSSGKADVITDVPVEKEQSLNKGDQTTTSAVSGFRTSLVMYNHTSEKMTKPVREALDKVVDRESIAKNVSKHHATPATGPFNTKLDFIDKQQVQKQDIDEAQKMMEAQGYTKDHPLKLTVSTYNGRPELPKMAQVFQSDAKKAHIDITIRNVDDIEGYLKDKHQWDASMYSFGTIPRGDTGYFFNQAYKPKGAINAGGYNNEKVTAMIDQFNKTVDKKERNRLTNEIIDITDKDKANSYLTYMDNIVGMNKQVENLKATPEGIYLIDYKVDKKG